MLTAADLLTGAGMRSPLERGVAAPRVRTLRAIMERFDIRILMLIGRELGRFDGHQEALAQIARSLPTTPPAARPPLALRQSQVAALHALRQLLAEAEMTSSAKCVDRMLAAGADRALYVSLMQDLGRRVEDDLDAVLCMQIDAGHADAFAEGHPFGDAVAEAFPSTLRDASEAARCRACGRHTAAVFHLMRVVEAGLRALVRALRLKVPVEKPTWNSYVVAIENACRPGPGKKKSARQREIESFAAAAAAHIGHISRAWRNPVVHDVALFYAEDEATVIFQHVAALMRHLATRVSE